MNQRNRTLAPVEPLIFLSDTNGEQVFDNAAMQYHTWDTVVFKTNDFHYIADDDRILINRQGGGFYEITFEVSWKTVEARAMLIYTDIYVNGAKLANAHAHTYVDDSIRSQHVIHFIVYLSDKDYVQIASRADDANVTTDPKSSRLIIKFIPLKGWNNDAGGKIRNKGGFI